MVTGHGDVPMTVQAMKAGAVEFLTKPFKDDVLLGAIRGAIERSGAALHLAAEMRALRNCYESLTPREREVMALVVSGLLKKQVGGELGISEITVKAHRGQGMWKMTADSLPDLVLRWPRVSSCGLRRTTDISRLPSIIPTSRHLRHSLSFDSPCLIHIPWCRSTRSSNRPAFTRVVQSLHQGMEL